MEDFEDMPTIQKAATNLGLTSPEGKIPGMEIKLMPHQLIGVDWLVIYGLYVHWYHAKLDCCILGWSPKKTVR
jgi:hypothetical protein